MQTQPLNDSQLKLEFLHQENNQLRQTVEDLKVVIELNKKQIKQLLTCDGDVNSSVDNKTIRSQDSKHKAMRMVIDEKDREIQHLTQILEKVQKERDHAQGKALINEEISFQAERSEKQLIIQQEQIIFELNQRINQQQERIQQLEKQAPDEKNGVLIKYREVINPNSQTLLMHNEMETLHSLIITLQKQINFLKGLEIQMIRQLHLLIQSCLEDKDIQSTATIVQNEFIKVLDRIQNSHFTHLDVQIRSQLTSPMNHNASNMTSSQLQNELLSPVLSPLPVKVLQPKKKKIGNYLNQTFDTYEKETVIPKLNLDKALHIQQLNAKRSTQQAKMSEEMLLNRIKKLEIDLEETKKNLQNEMLVSKHYELENDQMKKYILQLEVTNETLVQSNITLQERWQHVQKGYLFYKKFFVEHKDQFLTLRNLVDQEIVDEEGEILKGLNSARLDVRKETRRKKNTVDLNRSLAVQQNLDISSLIEVEKAMSRKYYNGNINTSLAFASDQDHYDNDLGAACIDREESFILDTDWRENCKRQWSQLASQIYNQKSKDLAQRVKSIQVNQNHYHSRALSFYK